MTSMTRSTAEILASMRVAPGFTPPVVKGDPTPGPRCGERAGCARHRRLGENPCRPCLDADNVYTAAWKVAHGVRGPRGAK